MGRDYTGDLAEGKGVSAEEAVLGGIEPRSDGAAGRGFCIRCAQGERAVPPAGIFLQKGRHGRAGMGRYLSGKVKEFGVRALVVGASGGIGAALVAALRERGEVVGLSRREHGLEVTEEASVAGLLGAFEPGFDLVVVATGALVLDGVGPEKSLRAVTAEGLARQFAVNAVGPALVMKHALRLMPRDRVSRLAVLSARVGSIGDNGLGGWYGYRAAKAALNQLVRTTAVEARRTHPQSVFVALHPGTVETGLAPALRAGHPAVPAEVAAGNLLRVLEGLGPEQSGGFFDWKGEVVPW